jgi:hypothetical protein
MATPATTTASAAAFATAAEVTSLTPTPPPDLRPPSADLSQRYCLKWNNYQGSILPNSISAEKFRDNFFACYTSYIIYTAIQILLLKY